jgi:hypothetical protein
MSDELNAGANPATKRVLVSLSYTVKMVYDEVLEVPADFDEKKLADLTQKRWDDVPDGDFVMCPDHCVKNNYFDTHVQEGLATVGSVQLVNGEFVVTPLKPVLKAFEKEALTAMGYEVEEDSQQEGLFVWRRGAEGCDASLDSRDAALLEATRHAIANGVHVCQNCGGLHTDEMLQDISDIGQRVAPGEPMPSGQCMYCGALAHPKGDPK